jgi:hypothetical protein
MFLTYKEHKAAFNPFGDGLTHWRAAELALHRPWFLVSISHPDSTEDDSFRVNRTMLMSSISDVEALTQPDASTKLQLDSVYIVTPGHLNGSSQWRMDPLKAVWKAEEPSGPG